MMRILTLLACLLAPVLAAAQPAMPPAVNQIAANPAGAQAVLATAAQQTIPRSNVHVWFPGTGSDQALGLASGSFANGSGGHAFMLAVELEDDFDAVQLAFANGSTSPFQVTQVVVAPSAQWNNGGQPGIPAFDNVGTALTTFMPVTFSNGGLDSQIFPPTGFAANATAQAATEAIIPLALSAAAATSSTTLTFTTTQPSTSFGGWQANNNPAIGFYVADGLGCIAPGTTVTNVSGGTVTISPAVLAGSGGSGCGSGQSIWFSRSPLGSQSITVPASVNAPQPQMVFSDWMPVSSVARSDAPIFTGMAVNGTGIQNGTTVTGVSQTAITISLPTNASPFFAQLTFTTTTTATKAIPQGYVIPVANAGSIATGQTVTGTNIQAGTTVWQVCNSASCADQNFGQSYVRLSLPISGAITSGQTLTLAAAGYSQSAGTGITSIAMESPQTPFRRLLFVRGFATAKPWVHGSNTGTNQPEHVAYGWPSWRAYTGPQNTGVAVDCVNFVSLCGVSGLSGAGDGTPVFMIRYVTRHDGIVLAGTGDSKMAGSTTATNTGSFLRNAANSLSKQGFPVTAVNAAYGAQSCGVYCPFFLDMVRATHPGAVVIQGITGNGADSAQSYVGFVNQIRSIIRQTGARVIFTTDTPRQAFRIGNIVSSAAVTAQTVIPTTLQGYPPGYVNGSGYAITSVNNNCIPAGTTVTVASLVSTITLSQPVTCPAGTVMSLGVLTGSVTNGSGSVTITTPSPFNSTQAVTGPCISANSTLGFSFNSTTPGLNIGASCTNAATTITVGNTSPASAIQQQMQGIGLIKAMAGTQQPVSVFDSYALMEDPANPTFYLGDYTFDGLHPDDWGHTVMGNALATMLNTMIGN